ncbi:protein kinase STUNTED-like [Euphorbia lathyris]|uniref:protein kinase STUNTED-like n=1 Tax=Euphorbia lathyris TaxID=212925 RepID=UPI0033132AAC
MPTERRNVLVGISMNNHGRELLSWALVKVAEPGDCVIALHVCRNSKAALDRQPLLDTYLEVYDGLCSLKKVDLVGKVCLGTSTQRTLVNETKNYDGVALVVGISRKRSSRTYTAGYCAKHLHSTTNVLGIHNGKIVFGRCNSNQITGPGGDPRPSVNLLYCPLPDEARSELGDSEIESDRSSFDVVTAIGSESQKKSNSGDVSDQRPGWPLLRRATSADPQSLLARELSVVQWAMKLPTRSTHKNPKMERNDVFNLSSGVGSYSQCGLQNAFEILLKTNSSSCKWFNYEVLKTATSKFSSANLIGEGECSTVYKGVLPDGKLVAVKVQNSSQETWNDFSQEVEIISSLNHNNVIRLKGVCIKDDHFISVYDFYTKGSLESNLQGKKNKKTSLPWKVRYDIAIKTAEALNYLHNKCSRPVIHRDIKSSNILLSHDLEPKLSDFGLAIWRPRSSYTIKGDVAGTFGYFAPEYFMYGKVSDKLDVYAFGVVLLELLSGKEPIASESPKAKGSLVMWANSVIESGNMKEILDPKLDKNLDEGQMKRMVVAAKLCITRSARLRPRMSEILKVLKGEKDGNKEDNNEEEEEEEEEAEELDMNAIVMDSMDDDSISYSSSEQGNIVGMEEYMKERWSRSSSFN